MTTSGRVLLADDSPHAQRMGERILREEGFEVVTVTDGETAIIRLKDVDPDIVIVDAFLPQVSGYDLCGFIKKQPQHSHVRVLLTSTALERVDEDQAYKAGADGQLKKPFEASVMLKSLKDLIGGSDKKKRAGTTSLDLSYSEDQAPAESEDTSPAAAEDAAGEKPVSALQAWLQQHDTAAYGGDSEAEDPIAGEEPASVPPATTATIEALEMESVDTSGVELSNPQLIRRVEEEPEDLSLRNNPVARLRYAPQPSGPELRVASKPAESGVDPAKPGARGLRIEPASAEPVAAEAARPPRKSLLEQLEEFEKAASESGEEVRIDTPFAEPPAAPAEDAVAAEQADVSAVGSLTESEPAAAPPSPEPAAASAVAVADEAASVVENDRDEGFLIGRPRGGRSGRTSLLDALGETTALESEIEELADVPADAEAAAPAAVSALPEEPAGETVLAAASDAMLSAATVSLSDAGVHLDDEEVRAVVEIAVSAAMPAIVEEVSRCVLLALESRYAEKAAGAAGS